MTMHSPGAVDHFYEEAAVRNPCLGILFVLLGFRCAPLAAQENSAPPAPSAARAAQGAAADAGSHQNDDLSAIRQALGDYVTAFNEGHAKEVAAHWTPDGDYVDAAGRTITGRDALEAEYSRFFNENQGVKIQVVIDSLRLLSDDAAIEDGRAVLEPPPAGAPAISKYTAVHVKVDGKWLMSTVRDTRVETPSAYRNVEDLEWLIGTWSAEE